MTITTMLKKMTRLILTRYLSKMKTIYKTIYQFLQENEWARERRNKDKAIVEMLSVKYPNIQTETQKVNFVKDFTSYDRIWRLILSENPVIRGKDYLTKDAMEQAFEMSVGYSPRYHQDKKLADKLF